MMSAVRFLFDVAEKKREFLDCTTCKRGEAACPTCPIVDQPRLTPAIKFYFDTWRQTREYNIPPFAGGLLDQEVKFMRRMDMISAEYNRREINKAEARKRKSEARNGRVR